MNFQTMPMCDSAACVAVLSCLARTCFCDISVLVRISICMCGTV